MGLAIKVLVPFLETYPTLADPTGPANGNPEMDKAAVVAIIAVISGSFSPSTDKVVIII